MSIPNSRVRTLRKRSPEPKRRYVLYWMVGARRAHYNFALQHAADRAAELGVGLVVFEPLRIGYRWASDRTHAAILAGMRDNQRDFANTCATYLPYVEPEADAGKGLLAALARQACLVVSDDTPGFFLPRMQRAAAAKLDVPLELVDGNGIYPIRETSRVFTTAASFRRHLQKELGNHLTVSPLPDPLAEYSLPAVRLAKDIRSQWPSHPLDGALSTLAIDHSVMPSPLPSGPRAARRCLEVFLDEKLGQYVDHRNQPEARCQSFLSPHLHFGHISSHEVFETLLRREDWDPSRIADRATGSRSGWWGASPAAEAFLDQLITWREIGFNMAALDPKVEEFESLPDWAQRTLADHEDDVRPYQYCLEAFETARTHDTLWNAAQEQLRTEGVIHNYLRMLWGKKILEWSATPQGALAIMIELNNKYALDGRDPNSLSGIFWTLGRYDRAWGPERPIFGKVRYMSSENTARKVRVRQYIERYAPRG